MEYTDIKYIECQFRILAKRIVPVHIMRGGIGVSGVNHKMKRGMFALLLACSISLTISPINSIAKQGPTYENQNDTYYTNGTVPVYMGPDYESQILTYIADNMPVQVVGRYTNGWYRINIGVVGYVKCDSLTTVWDRATTVNTSTQAGAALATANELGYAFHNMVLNQNKSIEKEIFNSYIYDKTILYSAIDDQIGVSFKMVYTDPVKKDVDLNYTKFVSDSSTGGRLIELKAPGDVNLYGQVAIFQAKVGYDKIVEVFIWDDDDQDYIYQGKVYTETSEFAYFTTTKITSIKLLEYETDRSLRDSVREKMANIRKGIKYLNYDEKEYRNSITNKLRKDTEYVDYYQG